MYQRYSLLPHQKQILDKLKVEREECGNFRNLVVAATGTGKTVFPLSIISPSANSRQEQGEPVASCSPPTVKKSFASPCTPIVACCKTLISVRCGSVMKLLKPRLTMPICLSPSPCSTHGLKPCFRSSQPIITTTSSLTKLIIARPTAIGNSFRISILNC